jgi:cation transport ATPase
LDSGVHRPGDQPAGGSILKVQEWLSASAGGEQMREITLEDYKQADRQQERQEARRGFTIHAIVYALVMTGLIILNLTVATQFPWAIFPLIFWSATLVAVILLGVTWTLAQRVAVGGAGVEDDVLLAVAGAGLAAASLVAGRIMVVVGRLRRRSSRDGQR